MTRLLYVAAKLALAQAAGATADVAPAPLKTAAMYALGGGVLLAAVGGAAWASRKLRSEVKRRPNERSAADATSAAGLGPSELSARHVFRTLQERKIATVEQLAAMSPRERQLLFDAVATKVTPLAGMPAVKSAAGAGGARTREVPPPAPAAVGPLHCPACGAALAAGTDAPRTVTHCDGCGRRVAARREGGRLTVTVDDR